MTVSESFDPFDTAVTSRFRVRWRDNHGTWLLIYTAVIGVVGVIVMAIFKPGRDDAKRADNASLQYGSNFGDVDVPEMATLVDPTGETLTQEDPLATPDAPFGQTNIADDTFSEGVVGRSRVSGSQDLFMIAVSGAESDKGSIRVAIYGSKETFPDEDRALFKQSVPIEAGSGFCPVSIAKLPRRIAIAAYHDENDNGTLDRGLLKIPTEAYGFTNRARGITGPPPFESAALDTPPPGSEVNLPIRH